MLPLKTLYNYLMRTEDIVIRFQFTVMNQSGHRLMVPNKIDLILTVLDDNRPASLNSLLKQFVLKEWHQNHNLYNLLILCQYHVNSSTPYWPAVCATYHTYFNFPHNSESLHCFHIMETCFHLRWNSGKVR
jgi:hypothetical protein